MSDGVNVHLGREQEMVRLYMELTGASESQARGVFMHLCCRQGEVATLAEAGEIGALPQEEAAVGSLPHRIGNSTGWVSSIVPAPAHG